jgi:predicted negative regulator of RcsB-dependent stress response
MTDRTRGTSSDHIDPSPEPYINFHPMPMDNSEYKEIASTLLDQELVEPDQLKKAIAAHKKAVQKGADISFLDFLVEKGLISPQEIDEHVRSSEQDTPTLDPPAEQNFAEDEPVEEPEDKNDFYNQYQERKSQSRRKTYVIVGAVLAVLGIGVVYAYIQYSQSQSARAAYEKAQNLKEEHQYQQALDVVSNQLLDAYPSSDVASNGKTLRDNIRKILDRKKEIESAVSALSSRNPEPNASPEEKLTHVAQTVERADDLYDKHAPFLKKHFSPPTAQQTDPDLLIRIDDLRQAARERGHTLWTTVFEQKKKQVRELIDQQKPDRAFDVAKAFQKNFGDVREPDTTPLYKQANEWINTEYRKTLQSAREMVKDGQADQAIQTFRNAMSAYEAFVSEERSKDDLKELQKLRTKVSSTGDEQKNRGQGVIPDDTGGAETDAVGGSNQ